MKRSAEYLQSRLQTCQRLFFEYNGREHARIEREMRAGGFPDFNRRCLYARGVNSVWIEKFRWDHELQCRDVQTQNPQPVGGASDIFVAPGEAERNPGYKAQQDPGHRTSDKASSMALPTSNGISRRTQKDSRKDARKQRKPLNEFHAWLKRVSPPNFDWDAKHLRLIIKTLQLVTEGKIKRLMIFMPPRHGKSELVTTRYTAWRLLKDPKLKVILASYAQSLANKFSRNIRNTLADHFALEKAVTKKEHERTQKGSGKEVSTGSGSDRGSKSSPPYEGGVAPASGDGVVLSDGDERLSNPFIANIINSAQEWETGFGGGVKAVGVGGGITGYGANLMMIDDPIKSREQAESKSYRDKVWHWFNDDMMTRLEPDAGVVLIQTRWHEDDLAGRLLKQQQEDGTDEWHVINLPAICEEVTGVDRVTELPSWKKGSPPYEGGVDAASADGVVLSATPKPNHPVKLMPARKLAFTTMPPYIPGKNYGDLIREREEAAAWNAGIPAGNGCDSSHTQAAVPNKSHGSQTVTPFAASGGIAGRDACAPVDPLNRRPGEALWPERFDIKHLERIKRQMGTYSFESLYQQKPVPTEGGMFKRSWFTNNIVQAPPPNLNWKRGYDLSFTANPDSDPSATLRVAYDKDGTLYIDGCFRGKLTYPLQRKMLMHYIKTETRTEHGIELSANDHAILQDLRRMPELRGKKFRGVKVDSSKLTRALPWIALAEEGRVRLVAGRWNEDFIQEACSFPHGHHDDQIDAVSVAVAMHGDKSRSGFWRF